MSIRTYKLEIGFLLLLVASAILILILSAFNSPKIENSTVKHLDTQRFLGRWFEIARFDHKFERGMQYVTAEYSIRPDGKIKVKNTGKKNGRTKVNVGKAKLTKTPGLLRVSFFGPFYSDYRIMMIDYDRGYALIGSSSNKYLWILSRTPSLSDEITDRILTEARCRGYNIDDLLWVVQ